MNIFIERFTSAIRTLVSSLTALTQVFCQKRKCLTGEVVAIVGAGCGIGRLMSINFAKQGATLVLWDINKEGNDETAEQIKQLGGKAHSYVVDVTKKDAVYSVAEQVTKDVGTVTMLVNTVGVTSGQCFLDTTNRAIERTVDANTMALVWTIKAFLPSMIDSNHGHIVTIGSVVGVGGPVDYCTSNSAALSIHDAVNCELAVKHVNGVHTTQVQLGSSDNSCIPVVEGLDVQFVADKIIDAVRRNQEILTIPGSINWLLFCKSWMPHPAFTLLQRQLGISPVTWET